MSANARIVLDLCSRIKHKWPPNVLHATVEPDLVIHPAATAAAFALRGCSAHQNRGLESHTRAIGGSDLGI